MKVSVNFTVEVDVDDWILNYGTPRDQVREDVRSYIRNMINESPSEALRVIREKT